MATTGTPIVLDKAGLVVMFTSSGIDNNYYGGLVGDQRGGIIQSWASGNVSSIGTSSDSYGGLVGAQQGGRTHQSWASGNVSSMGASSDNYGGLVGKLESGKYHSKLGCWECFF